MDITLLNTNNLAELWTIAGTAVGQYYQNEKFSISKVRNSAWPNKLWFHKVPEKTTLDTVSERWNMDNITIPVWGRDVLLIEKILSNNGYDAISELAGMSVELNKEFYSSNKLNLRKVSTHEDAAIWSALFRKCFGYSIDTKTVIKTMDLIDYQIGSYNEIPVGTGMLYIDSNNTAGIHCMGIIPEQRRKGYAEELLTYLLLTAQEAGAKLATLQASSMGEGLYLKTGFKEDFKLKYFKKQ